MTKIKGIMKGIIIICILISLVGLKSLDGNKPVEVGKAKVVENNYSIDEMLETVKDLPRGNFLALQIKELDKMISDKMDEIQLEKQSQTN